MYNQQQARPLQLQIQPVRPPQKPQNRPYTGKYAIKDPVSYSTGTGCNVDHEALRNQRAFLQTASAYPNTHPNPPSLPQYIRPGSYQAPPVHVRGPAPPLPTMAEVQRRQSNPQNSLEDYRRVCAEFMFT